MHVFRCSFSEGLVHIFSVPVKRFRPTPRNSDDVYQYEGQLQHGNWCRAACVVPAPAPPPCAPWKFNTERRTRSPSRPWSSCSTSALPPLPVHAGRVLQAEEQEWSLPVCHTHPLLPPPLCMLAAVRRVVL